MQSAIFTSSSSLPVNSALTHIHETIHTIQKEIEKEIIGQSDLIEKLLITFFSGGHALLEGVPGLGKTHTIRTLAKVLALDTGRISFTPDLLPSDLTGNEIYRPQKGTFEVRKGPIFTEILLADEINRTPPKVQSALLEAMEEKKVTLGETTFDLPLLFTVFATQNPIEHEGTYPLPEAQLDRFLLKITLDYPSQEDEKKIFSNEKREEAQSLKISATDMLEMRTYIQENIHIEGVLYDYIARIIEATRRHGTDGSLLDYGASTRAGLALVRTTRVRALMDGREYVTPDDVKYLAPDILRHRIRLSYEALSGGMTPDIIIKNILDSVRIL